MDSICECAADNKALDWEAALVLVEATLELNDGQVAGVWVKCVGIGHGPRRQSRKSYAVDL